jgi:hypothetical protein
VYSLGVILYEFLSGQKPHAGGSVLQVLHQILTLDPPRLSQLRRDLPSGLCAVVERAMARARDERFGSMLQLLVALQPFLPAPRQGRGMGHDGLALEATVASPAAAATSGSVPLLSQTNRRRIGAHQLALALVVALLAGASLIMRSSSAPAARAPATEPQSIPSTAVQVQVPSKLGVSALDAGTSGRTIDRPDGIETAAPRLRPRAPERARRSSVAAATQLGAPTPPVTTDAIVDEIAGFPRPEDTSVTSSPSAPAPQPTAPARSRRLNIDHDNPYE